jgi:hypothetical protein
MHTSMQFNSGIKRDIRLYEFYSIVIFSKLHTNNCVENCLLFPSYLLDIFLHSFQLLVNGFRDVFFNL